MDKHFARSAFDVVSYDRLPISNDIAKPYTDNILTAIGDVHKNAFLPSSTETASPNAQEWFDMFQGIVQECEPSTSIRMDMMIAVGRKQELTATEGPVLCSPVSDYSAVKIDTAPECQAGAAQEPRPGNVFNLAKPLLYFLRFCSVSVSEMFS